MRSEMGMGKKSTELSYLKNLIFSREKNSGVIFFKIWKAPEGGQKKSGDFIEAPDKRR